DAARRELERPPARAARVGAGNDAAGDAGVGDESGAAPAGSVRLWLSVVGLGRRMESRALRGRLQRAGCRGAAHHGAAEARSRSGAQDGADAWAARRVPPAVPASAGPARARALRRDLSGVVRAAA